MKKLFIAAALLCATAFSGAAYSQGANDVLAGVYGNSVGTVTIVKSANPNANYDVTIADQSGQCKVMITAATNTVTADGKNGAVFHPNTIVSVEKETYPNFSLWPEDQTIRLAPDALPFDKLDPACQAFKDNMVFNRQQ